ncbi:hypothetical protein BHE74_00042355 [Ensete ventricosum]|nr:hypothetical protein BHE74_00042355 [Ensete ventricosum]
MRIVNLNMVRTATHPRGHPISTSRAPTPAATMVQLSLEVEEVRAKTIVKEGVEASGKQSIEDHILGRSLRSRNATNLGMEERAPNLVPKRARSRSGLSTKPKLLVPIARDQ